MLDSTIIITSATSISIALIAILPLLYKYKNDFNLEKAKTQILQNQKNILETELEDLSLNLRLEITNFNVLANSIQTIFHKTKADRFLILTANNGKGYMKYASAILEQHKNGAKMFLSVGATSKYINFKFDEPYRDMLKSTEELGLVSFDVDTMPDCDYKDIMISEGLNFSNVYFLKRSKIDDNNDRLFYCSIATHDSKTYTRTENIIIKSEVDKIKTNF
jgi:hypothetical protein